MNTNKLLIQYGISVRKKFLDIKNRWNVAYE